MIKPLPRWVLTNSYPAFYDTESVTAIEMVAKLYGSMEELISDYNTFVDGVNKAIQEFEDGIIEDFESFKECVQKLMSDYIESIDIKMNVQDEKIDNAIDYMKDNLVTTVTNLYNEGFETHAYVSQVGISYDATNEELTILDTLLRAEDGEY